MIMYMRQAAAAAVDRDRLMEVAFEGIGSLPMAVLERYRCGRAFACFGVALVLKKRTSVAAC